MSVLIKTSKSFSNFVLYFIIVKLSESIAKFETTSRSKLIDLVMSQTNSLKLISPLPSWSISLISSWIFNGRQSCQNFDQIKTWSSDSVGLHPNVFITFNKLYEKKLFDKDKMHIGKCMEVCVIFGIYVFFGHHVDTDTISK